MGGKKHGPGGLHRYGNFYEPTEGGNRSGGTRDRTECCSEETMTGTSVVLVVIAVIFIITGIVLLALGSTESFWRRKVQEESGTYVDQYRYGNDVLDSKFTDDAYRAIGITMLISALLMILFSVYLCVAVYRGRNPSEEDYMPNRGGGGFGGGIGNDML